MLIAYIAPARRMDPQAALRGLWGRWMILPPTA